MGGGRLLEQNVNGFWLEADPANIARLLIDREQTRAS
jgi:hypothetical protein